MRLCLLVISFTVIAYCYRHLTTVLIVVVVLIVVAIVIGSTGGAAGAGDGGGDAGVHAEGGRPPVRGVSAGSGVRR